LGLASFEEVARVDLHAKIMLDSTTAAAFRKRRSACRAKMNVSHERSELLA